MSVASRLLWSANAFLLYRDEMYGLFPYPIERFGPVTDLSEIDRTKVERRMLLSYMVR